jgi:hypothetical protein
MRDARRRATRAAIPDKAIRPPWSMRLEEAFDRGAVASALGVRTEVMQQYPHPALGSGAVEKGGGCRGEPAVEGATGDALVARAGERGDRVAAGNPQ